MRKIKFRAWDEINNKWIDGCDLIMESSGRVWAGDVNNPPMIQTKSENVVFFTGLKDKNGTEIFEGAIVKLHYKRGIYKIGPVVWSDMFGSWGIDCTDFVAYKSLGQFNSVSEVIGNIYENPELLEVSENDNNSGN